MHELYCRLVLGASLKDLKRSQAHQALLKRENAMLTVGVQLLEVYSLYCIFEV